MITLIAISLSFGIKYYQNELYMTEQSIEQIKIETLFQKARRKTIDNYVNDTEPDLSIKNYQFPDGIVNVHIERTEENFALFQFEMTTNKGTQYTMPYYISNQQNENKDITDS